MEGGEEEERSEGVEDGETGTGMEEGEGEEDGEYDQLSDEEERMDKMVSRVPVSDVATACCRM